MVKLSKEEWAEIDRIKSVCHDNADKAALNVRIDFLCACLEKLRPKPERFTYELRDCEKCNRIGRVIINTEAFDGVKPYETECHICGGLGKIRVKVKRTAHSV